MKNMKNNKEQRNTAYCLSQLKYNEKSLRILNDKYEFYRHLLKDKDVLENFISITTKVFLPFTSPHFHFKKRYMVKNNMECKKVQKELKDKIKHHNDELFFDEEKKKRKYVARRKGRRGKKSKKPGKMEIEGGNENKNIQNQKKRKIIGVKDVPKKKGQRQRKKVII